ncbi:transposase [Sorangium sp. So ce302]|uniref:transposase n=1 Tax=Sorangium sp. So ce302 TaxID=3133297 RepID=UPI003F5EEE91
MGATQPEVPWSTRWTLPLSGGWTPTSRISGPSWPIRCGASRSRSTRWGCSARRSARASSRSLPEPADFELYLPRSWAEEPARRREARIPAAVQYKSKIDFALGMIERAVREGIPGDIVLADSFYGNAHEFRETVRLLGLDYAVGIDARRRGAGPRSRSGGAPVRHDMSRDIAPVRHDMSRDIAPVRRDISWLLCHLSRLTPRRRPARSLPGRHGLAEKQM